MNSKKIPLNDLNFIVQIQDNWVTNISLFHVLMLVLINCFQLFQKTKKYFVDPNLNHLIALVRSNRANKKEIPIILKDEFEHTSHQCLSDDDDDDDDDTQTQIKITVPRDIFEIKMVFNNQ